jgi:transposase InsO family protein
MPTARSCIVQVTRRPTAEWVAQRIVECCCWDREPPRFLIHDRDSRYGGVFDRRLHHLDITQLRTPFRSPRANAIAERWVRSARTECLDLVLTFSEHHLRHGWLSRSAISTAGGRTGRLVNAHLVRRRSPTNAILVATSLRRRCLVGSIPSTIWPHDQPDGDFAR